MVGNREELPDKMVEEILPETNEELAHTARLAREVERGKRHNDQQDNSGASEDEPGDGAPEVQFMAPSRPRSTPKPVMFNP
jgi:hypothetical protein